MGEVDPNKSDFKHKRLKHKSKVNMPVANILIIKIGINGDNQAKLSLILDRRYF